jgi:pyruvate, orthophosphate dikinase
VSELASEPSARRAAILLDGTVVPDREEIGNKAHGLATMHGLGMPVPPAFVLTTAVGKRCAGGLPDDVWADVLAALARLEEATGRRFGEELLVSVRSGAAQSMPGMMDTILNLGITDSVEAALAAASGDAAFARDTHRRFRESYARLVGNDAPTDPHEQLRAAICTVFASWNSPRAVAYRNHRGMSHDGGTAVTVQAMVYGNLDDRSGTGVLFTRDPQSGDPAPMGEFLPRGQGEDVVSGEVDPLDLADLAQRLPDVHAALLDAGRALERHARDVQDVEFTVERGRLYLLQTRVAKRSARAALKIAVDLVDEGVLTPVEALARIRPDHVTTVLRPVLEPEARAGATVLARGDTACPGIGSGRAVTDPDEAAFLGDDEDVVLVRHSTSPEDVHGMIVAVAVCTEVGGRTSHAAVVSRELGRPAVVGCGEGLLAAVEGRTITVDGTTGEVLDGILPVRVPDPSEIPALARLLAWAKEYDHPLGELT